MKTPLKLILIAAVAFTAFVANAQQDPMYSMYMFNGLAINPAYAGSRECPSVIALYRHQWTGLEGAPKTAVLSGHAPLLNNKIALGASLTSDNISIFNMLTLNFDYAYRIKFKGKRGKLSLGMNVTLNSFRARWQELSLSDAVDPAFLNADNSILSPNFGAGVYYYNEHFYAGVSVPHFLNMSLSDNFKDEATDLTARQWKHYFYTMGAVFDIGKNLKLKPSFLFKQVQNAPFEADINLGVLFKEAWWIAASYRTGDAMVFMTEYDFAKGVRIGYAYDYTLTELNDYTSGSHEIMIGYDFLKKSTYLTPRRMSYF